MTRCVSYSYLQRLQNLAVRHVNTARSGALYLCEMSDPLREAKTQLTDGSDHLIDAS